MQNQFRNKRHNQQDEPQPRQLVSRYGKNSRADAVISSGRGDAGYHLGAAAISFSIGKSGTLSRIKGMVIEGRVS